MAKILIVEDELMSRSMLELILQQAGHAVVCTVDGADALVAARQQCPDLIITDVMMPVMDGFELCRQCKADQTLQQVPIILYSSDYTEQQEQKLGLELGAYRYLVKPSPPPLLLAAINDALAEQQRSSLSGKEQPLDEEMKLLRNYNEVLFNKLEAKMQELQKTIDEQKKYEETMKAMQAQIIQQEKMASIGQLAAGVAHEINNPMGFITSNLTSLGKYAERLDSYIAALQGSIYSCTNHPGLDELDQLRQKLKVDYIVSDVNELINESLDGANRVRRIVQDLKSFSRLDQAESTHANLNECLDTTINIAWNELKYISTLERQFGEIPEVVCNPQQLNQVFLNLLVNAAQAMEQQGIITVKTWTEPGWVCVSVADTGKGMPKEVQNRIFEPFFTTKPAGKGTGLGLSISVDIIRKHHGEITVDSEAGKGTTFTVRLPVEKEKSKS
ncbi:His Kinase A (phospho-acceptor) domain-containing protein [Trichlorobacter thiogenes]|uniref:histidine kinase n=1 Tax=Trichlorobacter thiogenes TaxID=115783 RepID=A0A1T4R023_9BACT|nr:ATP-binding protein [Trichlorobacter thiogenes]SKA09330.1 His Kinase A (phospho-acceptor) domain-containing protein [Trichlorobacter thiogenes]